MKLRQIVFGVLLVLPILGFYYLHGYWVTNTPLQDDFDGLLHPATLWQSMPQSISSTWELLTTQDDERRVILNRLVAISITEAMGYLDFRWMKWIGLFLNFILVGLLVDLIRVNRWSWWTLVPAILLLYSNANYGALHWGMIPVQQIGVFVWGILALWAASRGHGLLAVVAGCLSLASDVSGVLILPAGLITLALRRDWRLFGLWFLGIGLAVFGYMNGLEVPAYRPSLLQNLQEWPSLLGMVWISPGLFLDIWLDSPLTFRIAWVAVFSTVGWYVLIKLTIPSLQTWWKKGTITSQESWILGVLAFLIGTLLIFALGRASEGISSIFDSRYRHIFHLFVLFIWFLVGIKGQYKHMLPWVVSGGIIWYGWVLWITWGYFDFQRQVHLTDMYAWHHQRGMPNTGIYYSMQTEVDRVIEEAEKWNVYRPADFPFAPLATAQVSGKAQAQWINVTPTGRAVEFMGQPRGFGKDQGNYLVLKSSQTSYILPIRYARQRSWKSFFPSRYYMPTGQSILIQNHMLKPGKYEVFLGIPKGNGWSLLETHLTFEPTPSAGG